MWNDLSILDKSRIMLLAVLNGITSLSKIQLLYDSSLSLLNNTINTIPNSSINTLNNSFNSGGKIHIKPENRGKFTALKERTGHSATWFKQHGTPALKKMAVFALNSRKWKHDDGGELTLADVRDYFWRGDREGFEIAKQKYENLQKLRLVADNYNVVLPEITATPDNHPAWTSEDLNNPIYKKTPKTIHYNDYQGWQSELAAQKDPLGKIAGAAIGLPLIASSPVVPALLEGSLNGVKEGFKAMDFLYSPSKWLNPVTGNKLLSPVLGTNADTAIQSAFVTGGLQGLYDLYKNGTLSNYGETAQNALMMLPIVGPAVSSATNSIKYATPYLQAMQRGVRNKLASRIAALMLNKENPQLDTFLQPKTIDFTTTNQSLKDASLAWFERPSRLNIREKLGLTKGERYYTPELSISFRNLINEFANKYGYEPIGEEVTDPEVLERYARSLIKRHNTFYRGVSLPQKGTEQWDLLENNLGKNFTEEGALKYMATNPSGGGAGEVYLSPFSNIAGFYGNLVEVTRPFKLGNNRTKWFEEGDFPLIDNTGHRELEFYDAFTGLTDPWNSGLLGKTKISSLSKEDALSLYKLSDYVSNSKNIPNEVTARNQKLIPLRVIRLTQPNGKDWTTSNITFTGSRKIADTPWLFTDISDINPYGHLNFYRLIEGLPIIKDGKVLLGKEDLGFVNFTTDLPFRLHKQYSHVPGGELMVINGGKLQGKTPISIEPMDSFFLNDIQLNPDLITIVTGNKDLLKQGKKLGFNMITSEELLKNYPKEQTQIDKFTKLGFGYREGAKLYKQLLDEFVTKTFGRPTLSDYKILEDKTGLKAGVEKYTNLLDEISKLNSIFKTTPAPQLPTHYVYTLPNKRELGVRGIMYPSYRDLLNYKNVFYDPVTNIELDLTKKLGFSQHPKNSEELVKAFKDYIKINSIKPLSTGGPLYPFSFSKIPYIKTPIVRY